MPVVAATKMPSEKQLEPCADCTVQPCRGAVLYMDLEEGRWEKDQGQQQKQAKEERFATLSKLFGVCNVFH